ncbi:MAG: ShlB/FhaC/HecB family hemolysin secretion/activation protein [Pseudomonadota bacterium]
MPQPMPMPPRALRPSLRRPGAPLRLLGLALPWLLAQAVQAQVPPAPPALPTLAEPGRAPLRPVLPTPGLGSAPISVPQAAAAQAPAGAEALRFTLRRLQIDGASRYDDASLQPLYAGLLAQEISVAQVFGVAQALELRYRNAGFVTTRVVVPQQTVEDGVFRIRVVEGRLSDIVFDADIGPARAAVERLLEPLRGQVPVSIHEIDRRLLLANDLGGLTVRATLEPAPNTLGGSVLQVRVLRQPREATLSLDSRSSPYLGWASLGGTVSFNALGARADRISLAARSSLETGRSANASAAWDALLSDDGLSLNAALSLAASRPRRELQALDVQSQVRSAQLGLTWPLIRSRQQNLRAVGQLELRDVDTDIAGQAFTRDRLRVLRLGLSYERADELDGISAARLVLHQGLRMAGARRSGDALASRRNGRPDFTKLTLDLTRVQQLGARSSLMLAATGQWSSGALLASEEMALGGASFGRGYDDGEIAADQGVAVSAEIRHHPQWAGLPLAPQLYAFVDAGQLRATAQGAPLANGRSLASAGAGVRADLMPGAIATLELAKPLNATPRTQDNRHPRLFLRWVQQF